MRNKQHFNFTGKSSGEESTLFADLIARLTKTKTLAVMASSDDFCNYDEKHQQNYLWTIEGFLDETIALAEQLQQWHLVKNKENIF